MTPIYGIVASEPESITVEIPLPDAYAIADFINSNYSYNGNSIGASSVILDDTPSVITSNGLSLIAGNSPIPFVSDFYNALFTFNWTVLFELDIDGNNGEHLILNVGSETPTFGYTNEVIIENWGDWNASDQNSDYPGNPPGTGSPQDRFIDDSINSLTNSIHTFGVTRTNNVLSLSVDGNAVQTVTTPTFFINSPTVGSTDARATVGYFRGPGEIIPNSFFLRKFQIFSPVSDADLVRLTAVPIINTALARFVGAGGMATSTSATPWSAAARAAGTGGLQVMATGPVSGANKMQGAGLMKTNTQGSIPASNKFVGAGLFKSDGISTKALALLAGAGSFRATTGQINIQAGLAGASAFGAIATIL